MEILLLIAAAGIVGVVLAKRSEAAEQPAAAAVPPTVPAAAQLQTGSVPTVPVGAAVLDVFETVTSIFTAVQGAGANVTIWDLEARRFLAEGFADDVIRAGLGLTGVMTEVFRAVGPSPHTFFTSNPIPGVQAAGQIRINHVLEIVPDPEAAAEAIRLAEVVRALSGIRFWR